MKKPSNKSNMGFTLLEVLVALAIFAVAAGAIIKQVSQTTRQTSTLEQKTMAWWVAENQMNGFLLSDQLPAIGKRTQTVTLADHEWRVETGVSATTQEDLRRIDIEVYQLDQSYRLAGLTGFKGKH
jgi:general secretion pathway protein I